MSEQTREVCRIDWSGCFRFTEIFRTFRLAIQPAKVGLALIGLLLTVLVGFVMDQIWAGTGRVVLPGEIAATVQHQDRSAWRAAQVAAGKEAVTAIQSAGTVTEKESSVRDLSDEEYFDAVARLPGEIRDNLNRVRRSIDKMSKPEDLASVIAKYRGTGGAWSPRDKQNVDELRRGAMRLARETHYMAIHQLKRLEPRGIFGAFLQYQRDVIRQAVEAACTLNITGQLTGLLAAPAAVSEAAAFPSPHGPGLLACVVLAGLGFKWLIGAHTLYAVVFLLLALAVWSLTGGAICRIAAMHAARDERPSVKQALSFAKGKFVGFAAAPLVPLGLIAFIGLMLMAGGLFASIPYVGEIVAGLLFFLALVGGFVMALVAVGAVAGGSLMWPTIAAEGSDSFDAISRSFSYVYSKPWRSLFYFVVASVYGALCFLFVRFFVFLMLKLTHLFVGAGVVGRRPGVGDAADKLDAMWQNPSFESLMPCWSPLGTQGADVAGGVLIGIWVSLVVAASYAFLISFYYCASTVIYLLLRREVDATDWEDVYLEEPDDSGATDDVSSPAAPAAPPAPAPAPAPAPPPVPPADSAGGSQPA